MRRVWIPGPSLWVLSLLLLTTACGPRENPILELSAEEAMEMGKDLLERKKYYQARRHLSHAFDVAPNSPLGREALLMVADTYFKQGGQANWIQAEAKYRDFLNRFPTSDLAPYAQLQIGNSLSQRVRKPDRDQSITENAERAYREVLELFPTSEHAAEAREHLAVVRNRLAEHEFSVGFFYIRFGLPLTSVQRFEGLLENFPEYREKDKVYYWMGVCYRKAERYRQALRMFEKLRREFPESQYIKKIPKMDVPPPTEEAPEAPEAGTTTGTEEESEG